MGSTWGCKSSCWLLREKLKRFKREVIQFKADVKTPTTLTGSCMSLSGFFQTSKVQNQCIRINSTEFLKVCNRFWFSIFFQSFLLHPLVLMIHQQGQTDWFLFQTLCHPTVNHKNQSCRHVFVWKTSVFLQSLCVSLFLYVSVFQLFKPSRWSEDKKKTIINVCDWILMRISTLGEIAVS